MSSARTNSSGGPKSFMDSTSEFSTPPPPSGPNLLAFDDPNVKLNELDSYMTFEERDAFKKIADEKLLEDAMAGQNLLGVMIEEAANAGGAKHKFKSSYSGMQAGWLFWAPWHFEPYKRNFAALL